MKLTGTTTAGGRRVGRLGAWMVQQVRRLLELKPQDVEGLRGCDLASHVILINNAGMPVPLRVVRRLPWTARCWLGRVVRWFEPLPDRGHERLRYDAYRTRLRYMTRSIREAGKTVVIIVHGGLEDPRKLVADAAKVVDAMHGAWYPIFVVWDSWLSALPEQLLLVRAGHYSPWGPLNFPFVLLAHVVCGLGLTLRAVISQVRTLYLGLRWTEAPSVRVAERTKAYPHGIQVVCGAYKPLPLLSFRSAARFLAWVVQSFFRAVFIVPINILAPLLWKNLQRRARSMYRAPREFEPLVADAGDTPPFVDFRPAQGAMAVLADELADAIGTCAGHEDGSDGDRPGPIPITLIAHSMGAAITNEFLQYAQGRLAFENIVYMAPACSVRDFSDAVVPTLKDDSAVRAYVLTLHPKVEVNEKTGWGFLPRGSVLEWIERFIDPPPAHLDRTLGKFENVMRALHVFPPEVRDRIHIKAFAFDEADPRKPCKHVHFNDPMMRFWESTFWWP